MTAEPSTWGTVDCPCGRTHTLSGDAWEAWQRAAQASDEATPTRVLQVRDRSWKVPRIWVAVHGFPGVMTAALAARYGWEEVPTDD